MNMANVVGKELPNSGGDDGRERVIDDEAQIVASTSSNPAATTFTPSEDAKSQADKYKDEGNDAFKQGHYNQAINLYTLAIDLNPFVAAYFANRSFANLRMEMYGAALEDATNCIKLDNKYIKGYYRRAASLMALGRLKQALKDFETVTKRVPNDPDAKLKLSECQKLYRQKQFEWAIRAEGGDSTSSAFDAFEPESIMVDDKYQGLHLEEDGRVTRDFMEKLLPYFRDQKTLHRRYACQLLQQVHKMLLTTPTLVEITVPPKNKFTICGDIHGQFYDLCNIFALNGVPSEENPYLFNGDFVDRGSFSMECILTLLGFKILYPNHFFLARGNHETDNMNNIYGFRGEVKAKYNDQMYQLFTELFNLLPLAHVINGKVLVMHGGIPSAPDVTLKDIVNENRNRQPPDAGLMCELLWSDPQPQLGLRPSKRGVAFEFGPDISDNFLKNNNLQYVVRSHEVKAEGYEVTHNGQCVTVFSAPNYCDTIGNLGALINITGDDLTPKFVTFAAVPHPNVQTMAYASSMFRMMGG